MSIKIQSIFILFFAFNITLWAQDDKMARMYFKKGVYDKAEVIYEKLFDKSPHVISYFDFYVQSLQRQDKHDKARQVLTDYISSQNKQIKPQFKAIAEILLGQYYHKHQDNVKATECYDKAFQTLVEDPSRGYRIAHKFHEVQALDYARRSYEHMMTIRPGANYYFQLATVYGELGDVEHMFNTLLDFVGKDSKNIQTATRYFSRYVTDDNQNPHNVMFRRLLVKRMQQDPAAQWFQLLSWLFVFQKDYNKALIQEQAAYMQNLTDLSGVKTLGNIAYENKDYTVTKKAFRFIKEHTEVPDERIEATYYLLESLKKTEKDTAVINRTYTDFFEAFPPAPLNVSIQVSYADFLAFYLDNIKQSIAVLDRAMTMAQNRYDEAEIKLKLGDVLVFDGQFNRALIVFTQIQNSFKNHPVGQMARYKVARTSYFKGDFDWANVQLKVLKRATSKLIANDAMDLSILIETNQMKDSTDTAIKDFATADLLSYQNKTAEAVKAFTAIADAYPGHPILDDVLFQIAQLYEQLERYEDAIVTYEKILAYNQDELFYDDACYHMARLYDQYLSDPEKALTYYERIVMDYPSSIYLVPSRKRLRILRGDEIMP